MNIVTVYSTGPGCQRCTMTRRVLEQKGFPYLEIDIREDSAAREYVVDELGYAEEPVVVVDDQDHRAGFQPWNIDRIAASHA